MSEQAWPPGEGEAAELVRSTDWSGTSLGPSRLWPQALRTMVTVILASRFPMMVLWGDELIQIYNDGSLSILGERHPRAMGQRNALCWPEVWAFNEPIYRRALKEGRNTYLEDQPYRIAARGVVEILFVTIGYSPIRSDCGDVGGVLVTLIETTSRVLRERASMSLLERQAKTFDTTLSEIKDFAYIFDREGRFVYANRPLLRLWGLAAEDAFGKTFFELPYPTELAERLHAQIAEVVASATIVRDETAYTSPEGETLYYEYIFSPVFDASGRVEQVVGSTRDVTHRRTIEQSLRAADQRKNEFLAVLAHELRNPLAPIRWAAKIAGSEKATQAQLQWSRDVIERQVQHMALLLEDLLDVSRISLGRIELRCEQIDLSDALDAAVEAARPVIEARRHHLEIELPAEPLSFHADPVRLAQIVANLLTNAAKYSDPEGSIWLSARLDRQTVVICVSDAGIGIDADMLPRVFEMFSQAHAVLERAEGGLGIGLALVKGLVELHGGTVDARSDGPGKGSRFTVRLPLGRVPVEPSPAETHPSQRGPSAKKILVVDDNRDAAASLATWLELQGHTIDTAFDAGSALKAAGAQMPEVILMDIGLPDLNGYEAAKRIRELPDGDKVILVAQTGWGTDDDKQRALAAGFDRHLTKPIDVQRLKDILDGREKT